MDKLESRYFNKSLFIKAKVYFYRGYKKKSYLLYHKLRLSSFFYFSLEDQILMGKLLIQFEGFLSFKLWSNFCRKEFNYNVELQKSIIQISLDEGEFEYALIIWAELMLYKIEVGELFPSVENVLNNIPEQFLDYEMLEPLLKEICFHQKSDISDIIFDLFPKNNFIEYLALKRYCLKGDITQSFFENLIKVDNYFCDFPGYCYMLANSISLLDVKNRLNNFLPLLIRSLACVKGLYRKKTIKLILNLIKY